MVPLPPTDTIGEPQRGDLPSSDAPLSLPRSRLLLACWLRNVLGRLGHSLVGVVLRLADFSDLLRPSQLPPPLTRLSQVLFNLFRRRAIRRILRPVVGGVLLRLASILLQLPMANVFVFLLLVLAGLVDEEPTRNHECSNGQDS